MRTTLDRSGLPFAARGLCAALFVATLSLFAFGQASPDEQIAAIASYLRQSSGNKLGDLSPEQVKQLRAKLQGN